MSAAAGLSAAAYAACVAVAWSRYGRATVRGEAGADPLLDGFMPDYDVAEQHSVRVAAPAEVTFAAAAEVDIQRSRLIDGLFRARAFLLGAGPDSDENRPRAFLAQMRSLGWGVLAETPGREIVVGAVTRPWQANVVFRALPPGDFRSFREPGYVKIAWTLRADPEGPGASIFRTETRVTTTDPAARARFRWYWARFSPGIVLIRRVMLVMVRAEAEGRMSGRRIGA
jgi:hypothetical protein